MINKQVWEARLLANFHNVSIADAIATKPTDVNGAKVTFTKMPSGNVKDYTGTIAWDTITTTPVELTLSQKKYFAFSVSDIEKVGTDAQAIDDITAEQSSVLAEAVDSYVLSQAVTGVHADNKIGNASTGTKTITKTTEAYDYVVDLNTLLSKAKTPRQDRFIVVNSDFMSLLQKDARFTANPETLANGIVTNAKINGATVVVSEEVPTGRAIVLHKSALGYANFIENLESMRLQTAFADGVRGLSVFDSKVLRDTSVAVLFYNITLA